jgi:uncharacterized membrane protein
MTDGTGILTRYEKRASVYETTFWVRSMVGIILGCLALIGPTLAALVALSLWIIVLLLFVPLVVGKLYDSRLTFPDWFIRGPH